MQRAGFDTLHILLMQPIDMRMGKAAIHNAEAMFGAS